MLSLFDTTLEENSSLTAWSVFKSGLRNSIYNLTLTISISRILWFWEGPYYDWQNSLAVVERSIWRLLRHLARVLLIMLVAELVLTPAATTTIHAASIRFCNVLLYKDSLAIDWVSTKNLSYNGYFPLIYPNRNLS